MLPASIGPAKKAAIAKVPYIEFIPRDGRIISLLSYFDETDKTFKQPFPKGNDIIFLKGEPVQGPYYARSAVDKGKDIYLKLVDLITRHCSFPSTMNTLLGFERDILNSSGIIEKYFILLDWFRRKKDALTANLVMTDIEFLFTNTRSIYDSLQILVKDVLRRLGGHRLKNLPNSYHDMVKLDDSKMKSKYNLPDKLIEFYAGTRSFFLDCKRIRDGFHHYRTDISVVFSLEEGFALQKNSPFFIDPVASTFNIWPVDRIKENDLVSVLALIAYINKTMIAHTDSFSDALKNSCAIPPPISREYKLLLRGPYIHHLLNSQEYLEKQWIEPRS